LKPRVSVVIPTYNRPHLLRRAIESVLNQTFDDFEVLIIDGARSKETKDIVESYGDGRLRYIPQRGKGIANARNLGVKRARGEFIAFLDDDDRWKENKLEIQIETFKRLSDKYCLIYTAFNYYHLEKDKIVGTKRPIARGYVYNQMLLDNITGMSTIVVRRDCFKETGLFREDFITCEDWDMWLRMSKSYLFEAIEEPLVDYSIHPGQFSFSKYLEGRYKIIESHGDIKHNPKILSYHLLQIGVLKLASGDKNGYSDIFLAFRLNPLLKKTWRTILTSIFDPRTRIYLLKFLGKL